MNRKHFTLALCLLAVTGSFANVRAAEAKNRWEAAIQAFEMQDAAHPPKKGGVVFVGSSSIRKWDLAKSFPKLEALNRGFGGSEVADSLQFADRIILIYEPRVVVVYAGDNDVARGKRPQQVRDDFEKLVRKIHTALPETKIVFIAIKPSIARWKLVDTMRAANRLIHELAEADKRLVFVDVDKPMIGGDGKPRRELFARDGLHLSAAGYKLWAGLVEPHLGR